MEKKEFQSNINFTFPDVEAYHDQKGVRFINCNVVAFTDVAPKIDNNLTSWMGKSWEQFHGPLISAVLNGTSNHGVLYPKTFPGPVISGPKHLNQTVGSTAWDVFNHMLTIPERVIDIDKLGQLCPPTLEYTPILNPENWIWTIGAPNLTQMQLTIPETQPTNNELNQKKEKLIGYVNNQVNAFIAKGKDMTPDEFQKNTRGLLELVQLVQSPFVRNEIPDCVVVTASAILEKYLLENNTGNFLPAIFQLESSLMYAYHMSQRDVVAQGFFGHSWIEVAKTLIEELRSTEIVDEKRVIDEVVNLVQRGWAPIITDENTNNTDGSHRGIAARVWSLLKHIHSCDRDFNQKIEEFVSSRSDMKGLTLRETLRVTQELLTDVKYSKELNLILEALPNKPDVKFVPTILLREQEACCVVKNPFDNEGRIIGVDPFVTFTLTNGRNDLALGSRGPYHRTDKTPAPWFDIFALQNK